MRPLEVLLLLVTLVLFGSALTSRPGLRRWSASLSVLGLAVLGLHWVIEGYRWQMIPGYGLLVGLAAATRWRRPPQPAGESVRRSLGVIVLGLSGVAVLAIAWTLPLLLPVFHLPTPTGPYPIGTVSYHWVDSTRGEPFTPDPADRREVMVQLWYPADSAGGTARAPYLDHARIVAPPLASVLGLPAFALDHLRYVRGQARIDAPVARARPSYPVLVFSPGRGGVRTQNTAEVQDLASHGYVVAAIDHPYGSAVTVFPDGRTAVIDRRDWPGMFDSAFAGVMKDRVALFAQDARFVLDQLQRLGSGATGTAFAGRLDLGRVGIFGHSLGGAVAAEASRLDPRFRAGVDLDAGLFTDVTRTGLRQPFMFLSRQEADFRQQCARLGPQRCGTLVDQQFGTIDAAFDRSDDAYLARIDGMSHYNFTDLPFFTPLARSLGLAGPIDPRRGLEIVEAYTLAFFDRHLRDRPAPLLDGPSSQYPEVHLRVHTAP
jgi:dienelactone hydrolase